MFPIPVCKMPIEAAVKKAQQIIRDARELETVVTWDRTAKSWVDSVAALHPDIKADLRERKLHVCPDESGVGHGEIEIDAIMDSGANFTGLQQSVADKKGLTVQLEQLMANSRRESSHIIGFDGKHSAQQMTAGGIHMCFQRQVLVRVLSVPC